MKNWKIPNKSKDDFDFLKDKLTPLTKRAYFAGGFVRDNYLNNKTEDIDIEVYDISHESFDTFAKDIDAKGVGKAFFVYKWRHFDISLPRVESKVAYGHRGFEVTKSNDTYEASKRRDFTINSMLVNIYDGTLIDHFDGFIDLQNKIIRVVDNKTFIEDSLRVLRAVQFVSRFGFRIEKNSLTLMRDMSLDDLSSERIFLELQKFFDARYLHFGLFYLCELGLDKKLFGTTITKKEFFYICLNYKKIDKKFIRYRFLYLLSSIKRVKPKRFLDMICTPNAYYMALKNQKKLPSTISNRWLATMSLKMPFNDFIGNYAFDTNISFDVKVNPQDVINDGFTKDGIKKEIRRREIERLRSICD